MHIDRIINLYYFCIKNVPVYICMNVSFFNAIYVLKSLYILICIAYRLKEKCKLFLAGVERSQTKASLSFEGCFTTRDCKFSCFLNNSILCLEPVVGSIFILIAPINSFR